MFFGIDETWRWRFREDELRYNEFWIQTVRYLSRNRQGRVRLMLDRQMPYRRGEPIKITVRFPDDAPPPDAKTAVKVVAERTRRLAGGQTEHETQTIRLGKVQGGARHVRGHAGTDAGRGIPVLAGAPRWLLADPRLRRACLPRPAKWMCCE